jgi:hypothetical protein
MTEIPDLQGFFGISARRVRIDADQGKRHRVI